ncbi:MAG: D-hexose-6-phosphate mutarotase [Betaproteobacteria bacterium]|nr:D-hexose-6-phosphate mutarotase [Betaproteobacteria bacterium]
MLILGSPEELDKRLGIKNRLTFRTAGDGLVVAEVDNPHASASICLQGGHVTAWQPKPAALPVVWLSRLAKFAPGKSIRGGAPVCWPWFGPHATEAGFPSHGYARTVPWAVTQAVSLADDATQITLELINSDQTRALWNHPGKLTLEVTVGQTLKLTLTTGNLGDDAFVISEALHTYLQVGDIARTRVLGLESCEFVDKTGPAGGLRRRQEGPLTFTAETDRIYVNTTADCVLEDPQLARRIRIAKSGSRSTVVWTPWAEKAGKMGDFGPDGWREMVCVESANVLENAVTIPGHGSHSMSVEYSLEN